MDVILAPDVYVNASVALHSPPEQVVQRVLGKHGGESATSEWVLSRVQHMLESIPEFKGDAVTQQLGVIRGLVKIVEVPGSFGPGDWQGALVATARAGNAKRVITDHPDLLALETADGIEFLSTEAWLVEQALPPPAPPSNRPSTRS